RRAEHSPVALLQSLEREFYFGKSSDDKQQLVDRGIDPILRAAAAAVAPFPVPTDAARLTRFWTFRNGSPALPAVALQLAAADIAGDWSKLLADEKIDSWLVDPRQEGSLVKSMSDLHHRLQTVPGLETRLKQAIDRLEPDTAKRLSALLALYAGDDTRVFN